MKTIILATNNEGKLREFRSLFPNLQILGLKDLKDHEEIEETGLTFEENALIKARTISLKYHRTVIADDSGLEVEALGGQPGIYSARYAGGHDDAANNQLLIKNLQGITNRKAQYVCAVCIYQPDGTYRIVKDTCEGLIVDTPKGSNGFGYDPYFYVEEYQKTMAEISLSEKNKISHRAKALRKIKEICNEDLSFK